MSGCSDSCDAAIYQTERTALNHLQLVTYIVYHKYINPKIKEIMSEEIRYQINGQLADNTVTVDNKEV